MIDRARGLAVAVLTLAFIAGGVVTSRIQPAQALGDDCTGTSIGETPLIDQGEAGALYEDGNTMPAAHAATAPDITPFNDVVGIASLGMSNADREWEAFMDAVVNQPDVAESIRFANGAIGGTPMAVWADPEAPQWTTTVDFIAADGLAADEVQVLWMKMGSQLGQLNGDFDERVEQERTWLNTVIANAADVFPNLKRIYMSSRIYAGYADSPNHAEPLTGYDNGFSVKATVADSIAGTTAVWTAWGPYLWADGLNPRSDGLIWECADFQVDGVHPSNQGKDKVSDMIYDFFSGDATTCAWFLEDPTSCADVLPLDLGPFDDVPFDHLFVDDITWLKDLRITLGCNPPDNTMYCPDAYVSRGEMAALLVRALHFPAGEETFTDDDSSVFEHDIEALAAAEVTLGCNPPLNTLYCPNAFVTRGEMAAFLERALSLPPGVERFVDDDGSIFEAEIEALAQAEITLGCNPPLNTMFCPDAFVTRGQMAAFLNRASVYFP